MSYQPPPPYYPNQQPGFYPPQQPPPKPPKRKWLRVRIILMVIAVILVIGAIGGILQALGISKPDTSATTTQDTPTASTTQQVQATTVPTTAVPTKLIITHGAPHLGGNISDFYGKYGTQIFGNVQSGSAPSGQPSENVGWLTDSKNGYLLSVQYYTSSRIVYYLNYNGSNGWSKAQYRDYLIANFAPPGTVEDTQVNQSWQAGGSDPYDPIVYTSDVGKFALHISDGDGNMNTV